MKLLVLLRTLLSYFIFLLIILIFIIPFFVLALLPKLYLKRFILLDKFYKLILYSTFLPIKIKGLENVPADRSAIFVANHQSAIDVPALGSILKNHPHIWMFLAYYSRIPIIGFIIRRLFIEVEQEKSLNASISILKAIKTAKEKDASIIIFPEGGRFIDGEIHKFFEGFAFITEKVNMPVIPVYMPNNGKIFPPNSFLIHYFDLDMIIGKPFVLENGESISDFTCRVREWFVNENNKAESMLN